MQKYKDALYSLGCIVAELNNKDCFGCHCLYSDCGNDRFNCKGVKELKILDELVKTLECPNINNFLKDLQNIRSEEGNIGEFKTKYNLSSHDLSSLLHEDLPFNVAIDIFKANSSSISLSVKSMQCISKIGDVVLEKTIYTMLEDGKILGGNIKKIVFDVESKNAYISYEEGSLIPIQEVGVSYYNNDCEALLSRCDKYTLDLSLELKYLENEMSILGKKVFYALRDGEVLECLVKSISYYGSDIYIVEGVKAEEESYICGTLGEDVFFSEDEALINREM